MLSEWIKHNCKFAQVGQQLLPFDPPESFSDKPEEHPSVQRSLEQMTPEGVEPEEWFDGFYHVTTNLPAVSSWGALKSRASLATTFQALEEDSMTTLPTWFL